jgi:hypothetical protein
MIPNGFNGRLDNFNGFSQIQGRESLKGLKAAKIRFPTSLEFFPKLLAAFQDAFLMVGVQLEIVLSDEKNRPSDELANCFGFVGNQLDPSGSWSFLLNPPLGPLSQWLSEVKSEFEAVYAAQNKIDSISQSKLLHSKLLSEAYVIPFMIGKHRYFFSKRIDDSRWNPFDSRMRLYQLNVL